MAESVLAIQPFSKVLGAEITRFDYGAVELEMPVRADLLQQHGFVHGGAVAALADMGLAFAGGSVLGNVVSVEMKINWVRPAVGEKLVAHGEAQYKGKTQAVTHCKIFAVKDGEEKICAIAQGTIATTAAEMKS